MWKIKKIRLFFQQRKSQKSVEEEEIPQTEEKLPYYENPYLPQIRGILEAVLKEKQVSYADFAPILVDGEDSEKTLLAAEEFSRDLNHLTILTDHCAYFENYADNMYEEQGLIVEIFPKKEVKPEDFTTGKISGNVILDFEQKKELIVQYDGKEKLYIPMFKRKWESAGNLDIKVPIGYNTVIVKCSKIEKNQPHLDKFEQAFYDNE